MMPGIDRFEVTRRIRQDEKTRLVPVVLVTALKAVSDRIKGIEAGCDDFISKLFEKNEILARIKMLVMMKYYRLQINEKEKLDYALNKMGDGFVILDGGLRVSKINEPAGRLLGIKTITKDFDIIGHV